MNIVVALELLPFSTTYCKEVVGIDFLKDNYANEKHFDDI